jgi:hypothetical protein
MPQIATASQSRVGCVDRDTAGMEEWKRTPRFAGGAAVWLVVDMQFSC